MEFIKPFSQLSRTDAGIAGGKGASLGEMTQARIPVPPGFVVLATAFERFLRESGLHTQIDAILHAVKHQDMQSVEKAAAEIKALILNVEMPKDIATEIQQAFKQLDAKFVAVRSSATAEDSASAAWAGQLDTYLNTTAADLLDKVKHCWASLFTPRAIFYRFEKNLHEQHISVSVVVQEMVASEVSGIAFSVHPVTEDRNQLIIEAGYGLGEAIVSGQITPDSYVVEKDSWKIIERNITVQEKMLVRSKKSGNEWQVIPPEQGKRPSLADAEVLELAKLIVRIEQHYGFPVDVEWARAKGKWYITQSRPITTLGGETAPLPVGEQESQRSTKGPTDHTSSKVRQLEKVFSREHALLYFEVWHKSDSVGAQLLGKKSPRNLFIVKPRGQQGSVWYEPQQMRQVKEKFIETFCGPGGKILLERLMRYQEESWKRMQPYLVKGRNIKTWQELKTHYLNLAEYWVSMNSFIWEVLDDPRIPTAIRETILSWRKQSEKYNERADSLKFLDTAYPQFRDFMRFLTLAELEQVIEGKASEAQLEQFRKRRNGCFMLDGEVYPIAELDARLRARNLKMEDAGEAPAEELRGTSAYGGSARGPVRVVLSLEDMRKVQSGDVLVAPMISPDISPILRKVAAIVTDEGGMMSHAAIVAREMRKPCIIGTKIATQVFKDGDMVEVDANTGVVRKL